MNRDQGGLVPVFALLIQRQGTTMKQKQRIDYLDYLRLVAIFGVITVHVATSLNFYHQDYAGLNWQILNFWDGLNRFCVPVFIMI